MAKDPRRRRWYALGLVGLVGIVLLWWLLFGAATVLVMPEQAAMASPAPFIVSAGMTVRISQPDSPPFPIARDRAAFDMVQLGSRISDESIIIRALTAFEWIDIEDGQPAYVVTTDGDAALIELRGGQYAGERAWIRRGSLGPR